MAAQIVPPIRVLGRTNADKGKQLESLTYILLAHRGFSDIVTNYIGAGGEEVDVRAKYTAPGLGQTDERIAICECKAHVTPRGMDDWMKFCGKLFSEEMRSGNPPDGYFIALSGVTGNVLGNYDALGAKRQRIKLITAEHLLEDLLSCFPLAPPWHAEGTVSAITEKPVLLREIGYYQRRVFWLLHLPDAQLGVLGPDGGPLPQAILDLISEPLKATFPDATVVDLETELTTARAKTVAERLILTRLMIHPDGLGIEQLVPPDQFALAADYEQAKAEFVALSQSMIQQRLAALIERGWVEQAGKIFRLTSSVVQNTETLVKVMDFLLGRFFTDWPGRGSYDALIGDDFAEEVARQHGLLHLSTDEVHQLRDLLRWSPSALKWAVSSRNMLPYDQRGKLSPGSPGEKQVDEIRAARVFMALTQSLMGDVFDAALMRYLRETREIVEAQVSLSVALKTSVKEVFSTSAQQRIQFRTGTELGRGRGFASVIVPNAAPQPWEDGDGSVYWISELNEEALERASDLQKIESAESSARPEEKKEQLPEADKS